MADTAVLDVGKSNIKLVVLDDAGHIRWSQTRSNTSADTGPYPHFPVDDIWHWLLDALTAAARVTVIEAINVSTHGACAVLLDGRGHTVLPVLDYEYLGVEACNERYDPLRPDFHRSFSPKLSAGLNLGRQLFWLQEQFPAPFSRIDAVLLYPQYWVWRLSGTRVAETTSLGCHTDLWLPLDNTYSALPDTLGIRAALPPLVKALDVVGTVTREVAGKTGLPPDCKVYAGVHDSNASFARYLYAQLPTPFTVVSSGTWIVTMAAGVGVESLREAQDTLANVNVMGQPLACARFMGGREFDTICRRTGAAPDDTVHEADITHLVNSAQFALPTFAPGSGPFGSLVGELPECTGSRGKALATLYLALMIDFELDLLGAGGDVVFGSTAQKNPLLCQLLAQLNANRRILLFPDDASTVCGAWCLTRWNRPPPAELSVCAAARSAAVPGLAAYRDQWRLRIAGRRG